MTTTLQKLYFLSLLLISSSKVFAQEIIDTNYTGSEVIFVGNKIYNSHSLKLSNTEFKKLAASFDDPSRVLLKFPGFSNDNDQANGIVYHGLPNLVNSWQVNNLDIINPNHLSNAGTFSDVSSPSAGGVNMFSGNVIESFVFKSPFDIEKNSPVIGGAADMKVGLKNSYLQASLLGLEAGVAINKGTKHQLYGNFRYSFTGILADMGVDFGGEKIKFADGVIGYNYQSGKYKTKLLYAKGISSNIHAKQESIVLIKDALDIDFSSDINIFQAIQEIDNSNGSQWTIGFSYSQKEDERFTFGKIETPKIEIENKYLFDQNMITFLLSYKTKNDIESGVKLIRNEINTLENGASMFSYLPYVSKSLKVSENISLDLKAEALLQKSFVLLPFTAINYQKNNTKLSLSISQSAQQLDFLPINNIDFAKSINLSLFAKQNFKKGSIEINPFLHRIRDIGRNDKTLQTLINYDNYSVNPTAFDASSTINGIGIYLNFFPASDIWINLNNTLFNANYKLENKTYNLENNVGYSGNINLGKDWKSDNKIFSIAASYHYRGGQYGFPVNDGFLYSLNYNDAPNVRLSSYNRLDLRINLKKKKYMLSLDIQNLLNKINDAYYTYDLDGVKVRGQLGLIPVLSYRINL